MGAGGAGYYSKLAEKRQRQRQRVSRSAGSAHPRTYSTHDRDPGRSALSCLLPCRVVPRGTGTTTPSTSLVRWTWTAAPRASSASRPVLLFAWLFALTCSYHSDSVHDPLVHPWRFKRMHSTERDAIRGLNGLGKHGKRLGRLVSACSFAAKCGLFTLRRGSVRG